MNWYKRTNLKLASVSFWINGTDKIAKPMTRLDICHDLANFVFYKLSIGQKLGIRWNDIDPDASSGSVFSPTGNINIYLKNASIKDGIIKGIVEQYNQYRYESIKLKFLMINKSGLNSNLNTARILVEENKTTELQEIPEFNVANANSDALIQLLSNEGMGQLDPYNGELDINLLKTTIQNIEQNNYIMQPYTQPSTVEQMENGSTFIDYGRSYEQLKGYIDMLKNMINYIEQNNLPDKKINYG